MGSVEQRPVLENPAYLLRAFHRSVLRCVNQQQKIGAVDKTAPTLHVITQC